LLLPEGTFFADSGRLLDEAIHGLARAEPQFSARVVITPAQCRAFLLIAVAVLAGAALAPAYSVLGLVFVLGCWFVANACFRAWLVWLGAGPVVAAEAEPAPIADADLPGIR
jgi:hypothetical protein